MILRLSLRDFLIVEHAVLEFAPGLNVLTGETGAGKSILVDALGFLCGGRAGSDWIRQGAAGMMVEGAFDLTTAGESLDALLTGFERTGIPREEIEEGGLLLRREMGGDGRSRCFANGRQLLVSQIKELTGRILWIVGQGEQRALGEPAEQLWLLDRYGRTLDLREEYRAARGRFLHHGQILSELRDKADSFAREEDWLAFQAREIRAAAIRPGEKERLRELRLSVKERARQAGLAEELRRRLHGDEGSVADHVESLLHQLSTVEGERWGEVREKLLQMRELVFDLRRVVPEADDDGLFEEEAGLTPEAIEERLLLLDRLARKYGEGEESILAHLESTESRLREGESFSRAIEGADGEFKAQRAEVGRLGGELSHRREHAASDLASRATAELPGLGMPGATLGFRLTREEDVDGVPVDGPMLRPLETGLDRAQLLFRPHPTESEGELTRVASGGELSRILLALHTAMGEAGPPGSWVLDEVDQGIAGETAHRVGERLAQMASRAQVLLVTHLPVIAARADRHLGVTKEERGGRPAVSVEILRGEPRLKEIARMLSGEGDSAIARRHALDLLDRYGRQLR